MAYGLDKEGEQKILVFDLGAGTLDVTIMEFGGGTFNVLATAGDTQLGGTDMDNLIVDWIVEEFRKQEGVDLRKDRMAMQRVREAAEKAKIELSTVLETEINLPYITADQSGPKHLSLRLTRAKLEQLVEPVVRRCAAPIEQALADAKLKPEDIDRVILVGGPTRMPIIQRFIEERLGKKIVRGVDPMECVAMGAAIQGAILAGEIKDIVLLDVTPLTLGIETLGGIMTPLIPRNTTIPTRKSQIFTTASDFQTAVTIHVLQGERPMAADNISLGQFTLTGIPPAPRGVPQIEVTFDIDASGILHVSAKDLATGKEQKMTITAPMKLSEEEIQRMIKEAKEHEEEDRRRREEAELRNNADALIYSTEKMIAELGDKLSKEQKDKIEASVKELKTALEGKDVSKIRKAMEGLQKVLQEAGTALYQEAARRYAEQQGKTKSESKEQKSESTGRHGKEQDNIIDADYKVEDEK
jgi:molecular chaperone DnaK